MKKTRTVVKAVRITEDLDDLLEHVSKERKITSSTLISTILSRYLQWDRLAEGDGMVTLMPTVLSSLLDATDEKTLERIGKLTADRIVERIQFWDKKVNLQNFLKRLEASLRYSGTCRGEYETIGEDYVITLRHNFNRKWSMFLAKLIDSVLRSLSLTPTIEITESSLYAKFKHPNTNKKTSNLKGANGHP